MEPDDLTSWHQYALTLAAQGKRQDYGTTCARLLERFGETDNSLTAKRVAWIGALLPDTGVDQTALVRLIRRPTANHQRTAFHHLTLGAALYRAGQFEEAITQLNLVRKQFSTGAVHLEEIFLAMALQRLGRTDDARRSLDRAAASIDKALQARNLQGNAVPPLSWYERLQAQLLRSEAEELLKETKP